MSAMDGKRRVEQKENFLGKGGKTMCRRWGFVVLAVVMVIGLSFPGIGQSAATPAKKVNIAVGQDPSSLDATFDSYGANAITLQNIYEFLIGKDTKGNLIPGLASSWKISPDGKVYDFTLRKGVKFHSGDPFTAKDVVFTFERSNVVNPRMKVTLRPLEKLEVVDDYRIRFLWKTPDVTLIPNRLGVMIASKSYHDRVGEDKFVKEPVGTGPYKVVNYEVGQYIDLERFEDYWGKKPAVREARMYFVAEDTTRMAKLQAGEVDMVHAIPYNMVKMVESSPNLKAIRVATNSPSRGIVFSNWNPKVPWYDKRVRMAMAYALDCDSILKNVLFGIPNRWPWLAPDELGYDATVQTYPYDPKRAKQLLAEAGYPNGFEFNFYWQIGGRVPMSSEVVQAVASYFEAVGIRTKLVGQEQDTFNTTRRAGKKPASDFVGYIGAGIAGSADPIYSADNSYTCEGSSSVYCNKELDKIITEGRATMNDAKRAELIKRVVKILREEAAGIPIFDNVSVYGMQKNIDFVPTQDRLDTMLIKDITVK
jgi:peptide/nickel transport system substrate-binding protein